MQGPKFFFHNSLLITLRVIIKLLVIFFAFYLDFSVTIIALVGLALVVSEGYEIAALYLSRITKGSHKEIYAVTGVMNIILSVGILHFTELLNTDFTLFIFAVLVFISLPTGLFGALIAAITGSVLYMFLTTGLLSPMSILIRTIMFILTGVTAGVIAEFAQTYFDRIQDLEEKLSHSSEAKNLKQEFLSIASHNLRAPIAQLKGYQEVFQDSSASEKDKQKIFGRMTQSVYQIERLVEQILTVMGLEGDEKKRKFVQVDILTILEKIVSSYKDKIKKKNIKLNFETSSDAVYYLADEMKITTGISKVIENAMKYTPVNGEVSIRLNDTETEIWIEISDTGPGIPSESLKHIFKQEFYRVNPMTPETEGYGLGLYISQLIVNKHGGRITISSKEGQGTKVIIYLPKITSRNLFEEL